MAELSPKEIVDLLSERSPEERAAWFAEHPLPDDVRAKVDEVLKDWWHMCVHLGSLDWVVTRLAGRGLAA